MTIFTGNSGPLTIVRHADAPYSAIRLEFPQHVTLGIIGSNTVIATADNLHVTISRQRGPINNIAQRSRPVTGLGQRRDCK